MKTKGLTFLLIFSLAINVAMMATIGYHYYRNTCLVPSLPCPMSPRDGHLYQSLGLSNAQLTKMDPLAKGFHSRLAELGSAMEGKRELLVNLLAKEGDSADVENLRREMAKIQDEIQKEVIAHITETKKILDPGQQQRFFELMRESMSHTQSPWSEHFGGKK